MLLKRSGGAERVVFALGRGRSTFNWMETCLFCITRDLGNIEKTHPASDNQANDTAAMLKERWKMLKNDNKRAAY